MSQQPLTTVPMSDAQRLVARARLLRRTGKTYDDIRTALDIAVSDDRLKAWLRGIPRPPETRRSRRLTDLRRECRRLRADGLTYDEIASRTGATKGSMSLWLRGIPGPDRRPYDQREHWDRIQPLGAAGRRRAAEARRDSARSLGRRRAGAVSQRDLFIAGIALYWAEGSKDKPWRRNGRVVLINGDPGVMKVFLSWLDLMGVPEDHRQYRLSIHESADVGAQEAWWAAALGIPPASFSCATLKRHRPTTVRLNVGDGYHGCLVVSVRRSRRLYDEIEGAWGAIATATFGAPIVHTGSTIGPP
jgi:transcriptional regulator with XRE-family HTH domain